MTAERTKHYRVAIYRLFMAAVVVFMSWEPGARAQALRFSNQRDIAIPEYATLHIGPFYSTITFIQTVGLRYSRSNNTNTSYLIDAQMGAIQEDGLEFPLISRLEFRNYLLIAANIDLDLSLGMSYAYYPMETQEDAFNIHTIEEGIFGNISMTMEITPFVKATLYDNLIVRTDYIDARGFSDEYGGDSYRHWRNTVGVQTDWEMSKKHNLGAYAHILDVMPLEDGYDYYQLTAYHEGIAYTYAIFPGVHIGARADFIQTGYADPDRVDTFLQSYSLTTALARDDENRIGILLGDNTSLTLGIGYAFGYGYGYYWTDAPEEDSGVSEGNSESVVGSAALTTQLRKDLSHSVKFAKSIDGGFNTGFETSDEYSYRLYWQGEAASINGGSALRYVQPNSKSVNSYSNWKSDLNLRYPLIRFVDLLFSTAYTVRVNKSLDSKGGIDAEWANDYATWVSSVGTSFAVTRSIGFSVSYQHIERYSDSSLLAYERDIFLALLSYKHEF
ncbi:MAG: hypothetical protein JXN60_07425 [Lentisphaerae bacterium]|nr:hypothetical protein [Lentisphaerota bacterium]